MPRDQQDKTIEIPEERLYELYSTLSDATTAASTGDTNECIRLTAEAKNLVVELHEEYA